jgi:hypothetical protein
MRKEFSISELRGLVGNSKKIGIGLLLVGT